MFLINEEIYNRPETLLIDAEFKKILDWFRNNSENNYKKGLLTRFNRELRNIEKLILKLMNATIILKIDDASNPHKLSFGMCIYASTQELHNKIVDAAEKEKTGFYLTECSNCMVLIDLALINLIKYNNLNERHLTAVLLHELGHKVYVKSQDDIYDREKSLYFKIKIFGKEILISKKFLKYYLGLALINNKQCYVDSEHLSDLVATKYGYGKEIYETMNLFYTIYKNDKSYDKRVTTKRLQQQLDSMNVDKMRRDKVKEVLKKELKDKRNSKETIDVIKKTLEEIEKIEKDSE